MRGPAFRKPATTVVNQLGAGIVMGMTIVEKILARHAGLDRVKVGDIVTCTVDRVMEFDLNFFLDALD